MTANESEEIFVACVEAIPAEDDHYQIILHVEEDGHQLSMALQIIELSGANLHSLSVLPSPAMKKKIAVFRFNDLDLKDAVLDLIRHGFFEVKGCGPKSFRGRT